MPWRSHPSSTSRGTRIEFPHALHAQLPKLQNCSQLPTLLLEHAPTCTSPYMNRKARTDQAGGMRAQAVPTDPQARRGPPTQPLMQQCPSPDCLRPLLPRCRAAALAPERRTRRPPAGWQQPRLRTALCALACSGSSPSQWSAVHRTALRAPLSRDARTWACAQALAAYAAPPRCYTHTSALAMTPAI